MARPPEPKSVCVCIGPGHYGGTLKFHGHPVCPVHYPDNTIAYVTEFLKTLGEWLPLNVQAHVDVVLGDALGATDE